MSELESWSTLARAQMEEIAKVMTEKDSCDCICHTRSSGYATHYARNCKCDLDPNIVTETCKGCDSTFERPRALYDWYCKDCKQLAEDCYTGFWAAFKITDTEIYGIGEFNTFQDTSVGVYPRRWIKAFTRKEVTSVINTLAQVHNGYVVTDGMVSAPHPIYLR